MSNAPGHLSVMLAAETRQARAELEALLARMRWHDGDTVLIAVHEALTNADLHGGGIREATATVLGSELRVEIADHSGGYDASAYLAGEPDLAAERGRGLWLMNELASSIEFLDEPDGRRVVLRFTTTTADPVVESLQPPSRPPPSLDDANARMLTALGAAVAIIDTGLVVRDASGPYTQLFGLQPEALVGRDARGVLADMKRRFNDPAGFEDRSLTEYAANRETAEHLFLLADGRLIRRLSVMLRDDGAHVGWVVAYIPVAEQTQLVATMQQSLLPAPPDWGGLDMAALYHPAQEGGFVGGDFYDFVELSSGNRCIVVGDVSGRGTAAAASSMRVRAYLRAALSTHGVSGAITDLEHTLEREFAEEEFVTLAMCVEEGHEMWTLTSCGHVPSLLLRNGTVHEFDAQGPILGFGVHTGWGRAPFRLRSGDVLLMYTDGVLEAGRGRERFGQERLHEALRELGSLPTAELVSAIDERVHAFAANSIGDDHILLGVRQL